MIANTMMDLTTPGARRVISVRGTDYLAVSTDPSLMGSAVVEVKKLLGGQEVSYSPAQELSSTNGSVSGLIVDGIDDVVLVVTTNDTSAASVVFTGYSEGGSIQTPRDFTLEVASGRVPGYEVGRKFGRNTDIDTGSVPEDLWGGGGTYTGILSSAETLDVFSSDAADTAAGTGARTVQLVGLDANWEPQTETVTMNGTSTVVTSNTWLRCWRQRVITTGSGNTNAGQITVRPTTTTSAVMSQVQAGTGQSTILFYTVPADKKALFRQLKFNVEGSSSSSTEVRFQVQTRDNANGGVLRTILYGFATRGFPYTEEAPFTEPISEKTDIWVRVTNVSNSNTIVSGDLQYMLVPA